MLALFDIDEFKRNLEQLSEVMWEPFIALDGELRVVRANEAFYKKFQGPARGYRGPVHL